MRTLPRLAKIAFAAVAISAFGALTTGPASAHDDDPDATAECDEHGADTTSCQPTTEEASSAGIDVELRAALVDVGFIDTWYAVTSTDPRLSLAVVNSRDATNSRQSVLDRADDLVTTREKAAALRSAVQDTLTQRRNVEGNIASVDDHVTQLRIEAKGVERDILSLRHDRDIIISALQDTAVGLYVSDTQTSAPGPNDVDDFNDRQALGVQIDATIDELFSRRDDLESEIAQQMIRLETIAGRIDEELDRRADLVDRHTSLNQTLDDLTDNITQLAKHRIEVENSLPQAITEAQTDRLMARVPALGISLVTLDAYVRAADQVTTFYPACSIQWELLAGVAFVESHHATLGGGYVFPDGRVSRQIRGPVLDGTVEDTMIVTDTDNGVLDRNSEFDAAVGPFQFLPQTWRTYRLDANNDQWADPHNLYDAALSAAGYLCTSSTLSDDSGIRRSILTYNDSQKYLKQVTQAARGYTRDFSLPDAGYDPDTIVANDGWRVRLGPDATPEALSNTGN